MAMDKKRKVKAIVHLYIQTMAEAVNLEVLFAHISCRRSLVPGRERMTNETAPPAQTYVSAQTATAQPTTMASQLFVDPYEVTESRMQQVMDILSGRGEARESGTATEKGATWCQ